MMIKRIAYLVVMSGLLTGSSFAAVTAAKFGGWGDTLKAGQTAFKTKVAGNIAKFVTGMTAAAKASTEDALVKALTAVTLDTTGFGKTTADLNIAKVLGSTYLDMNIGDVCRKVTANVTAKPVLLTDKTKPLLAGVAAKVDTFVSAVVQNPTADLSKETAFLAAKTAFAGLASGALPTAAAAITDASRSPVNPAVPPTTPTQNAIPAATSPVASPAKTTAQTAGAAQSGAALLATATTFMNERLAELQGIKITNARDVIKIVAKMAVTTTLFGCPKNPAIAGALPSLVNFQNSFMNFMAKLEVDSYAGDKDITKVTVAYLNAADLNTVRSHLKTAVDKVIPQLMALINPAYVNDPAYVAFNTALAERVRTFKMRESAAAKIKQAVKTVTDFTGKLGSLLPGGITKQADLTAALATLNSTTTYLGNSPVSSLECKAAEVDLSPLVAAFTDCLAGIDKKTSALPTGALSTVIYLADLVGVKAGVTTLKTTLRNFVCLLVPAGSEGTVAGYNTCTQAIDTFVASFKSAEAAQGQATTMQTMMTTAVKTLTTFTSKLGNKVTLSGNGISNAQNLIDALTELNTTTKTVLGCTPVACMNLAPATVVTQDFFATLTAMSTSLAQNTANASSKGTFSVLSSTIYLDDTQRGQVKALLGVFTSSTLPTYMKMFVVDPSQIPGYTAAVAAFNTAIASVGTAAK